MIRYEIWFKKINNIQTSKVYCQTSRCKPITDINWAYSKVMKWNDEDKNIGCEYEVKEIEDDGII